MSLLALNLAHIPRGLQAFFALAALFCFIAEKQMDSLLFFGQPDKRKGPVLKTSPFGSVLF